MEEYNSAQLFNPTNGCVITIGTFDGVHIGHRAILEQVVAVAKAEGLTSVLLTFFPHPRMVLQNDSSIKMINTLEEKKHLLNAIGVDHMVVHPFTREFSRMTAMEYVRDILVEQLHAKKVIIGYDHRFGRNRDANIDDLREFGEVYGFDVIEIGAQQLDEVSVSSTKIRKALKSGDIDTANRYLGYCFSLSGTVVPGHGRGRKMDYPTANLKVDKPYKLVPAHGVYLTRSSIEGKSIYGLTSIGTNPTFEGEQQTIETYFLDLDQDLYEQQLTLEFMAFLRGEQRFESAQELIKAIEGDEAMARKIIQQYDSMAL